MLTLFFQTCKTDVAASRHGLEEAGGRPDLKTLMRSDQKFQGMLLDEGNIDTLKSMGATSGARTSFSMNTSDSANALL